MTTQGEAAVYLIHQDACFYISAYAGLIAQGALVPIGTLNFLIIGVCIMKWCRKFMAFIIIKISTIANKYKECLYKSC